MQCGLYNVELVQSRMCKLLEKYCSGLWMSKLSEVYSTMFTEKLHPQALIDLEKWAHICMVSQPLLFICTNALGEHLNGALVFCSHFSHIAK